MLKLVLLTCFTSFAANAYQFEELNNYEVTAKRIENKVESISTLTNLDLEILNNDLNQLIEEGKSIMALYETKKPECTEQYKAFYADMSIMEDLSFDEVHKKYHDGKGLPPAPKLCYLGRSQVVHPVLTKIVLKEGWNQEIKEEVLHEIEEVIEHLPKIETLLTK